MRDIILSLPAQILEIVKKAKDLKGLRGNYNRVLICGMGGSGIGGEILSAIYPEVEIIVNRDYKIPDYIDRKTLAILVSYSGNTEETLRNYDILQKKDIHIAIISSDGELLKRKAFIKIKIPPGLPPRGALGYLFTPLPFILYKAGIIKENPEKVLYNLAIFLKEKAGSIEKKGRVMAKNFGEKLPVIYANSYSFGVVANRWRCQMNENSKILCHTNIIPEMHHNEIVGLGRPEGLHRFLIVIFLNDPDAHPKNRMRVRITKDLIKREIPSLKVIEINPLGNNRIERVFWAIMLGDFLSFYLAIKSGIDPIPVKRIDYLKNRLKQ